MRTPSSWRKRTRRWQMAAACALATWWLLAVVTQAGATETIRGGSIRVPSGSVVSGDLRVVAGRAQIDGAVDGNLHAATGYLNVVGPVVGEVVGIGGRIEIRGTVRGSIAVAGASLALYGHVDGDVVVTGGTIRVVEGAQIGGDLVLIGASAIVVDGAAIASDVRGAALSLTIEGQVAGDVHVTVRRAELAPTARIGGSFSYESRAPAAISPAR
jgi:cytoskeletal protein CcmA (bactofilin family)